MPLVAPFFNSGKLLETGMGVFALTKPETMSKSMSKPDNRLSCYSCMNSVVVSLQSVACLTLVLTDCPGNLFMKFSC